MKAKIEFLVNAIKKHRVAVAVGLTATAFVLLMLRNAKQLNAFLEEHGLTDEYYKIEE